MARKKGCPNEQCVKHILKEKFNEEIHFCPNCGTKLLYICNRKKCSTFLDENDGEMCQKCSAEIKDKREAFDDGAKKVAVAAGAAGVFVARNGRRILEVCKDTVKFVKDLIKK